MKRIIAIAVIAMLLGADGPLRGQERSSLFDRLYAGGSMGLSVGGSVAQIDLLPVVGVWVFRQWTLGLGGRYSFRKARFSLQEGLTNGPSGHIWGASVFTQVLPIPSLHEAFGLGIDGGPLLHAEYERLWTFSHGTRSNDQLVMLGAGWRQRVGPRTAMYMMVLWNLSSSAQSLYADNPVLRFCITF